MNILDRIFRRKPTASLALPPGPQFMAAAPPSRDVLFDEINDIPISGLANWTVTSIRSACMDHCNGQFQASAILAESMVADDKIQSGLNGRSKGLTSRSPSQKAAPKDRRSVVADEVQELWPDVISEEMIDQMIFWTVFSGFALFKINWTVVEGRYVPSLEAWNLRYCYFDWNVRKYACITANRGVMYVDPVRDPRWLLITPHGYDRGYIRAGVRSLSIPWVVRSFALRDWARFSEKHGLPLTLAKVPAMASWEDKQRFFQQVRNLGAESTILLPTQGGEEGKDWDAMLLECKDTSWKSFPALADYCSDSITLTIRGTNLTTKVESGSLAASKTHAEQDSQYADSDARKLCKAVREKLWYWYALLNHGSGDLAPRSSLEPPDSEGMKEYGEGLSALSAGVASARAIWPNLDVNALAKRWNVPQLLTSDPGIPDPDEESEEDVDNAPDEGMDDDRPVDAPEERL